MKKLLGIALFVVSSAAVFAGCLNGNEERDMIAITPNGSYIDTYCCTPVGDGSVQSCTDGEDWWNEPT